MASEPNWFMNQLPPGRWADDATYMTESPGGFGQTVSNRYELPGWGQDFGSPRALWDWYNKLDPELAGGEIATRQGEYRLQQEWRGFLEQALGGLDQTQSGIQESLNSLVENYMAQQEAFKNDPYRRQTMQELSRRAQPGYDVVTPAQRSAGRTQIGSNIAAQRAVESAANANRGIAPSGYSAARDQALLNRGQVAELGYKADLDAINNSARQTALSEMGRMNLGYNAADLSSLNAVTDARIRGAGLNAGLASNRASLLTNVVQQPPDFTGPLAEGQSQRMFEEWLKRSEEEAGYNIEDLIALIGSLQYTGIPKLFG